MKRIWFTLALGVLAPISAVADGTLLQQQVVSNLEFMRGIYRTEYAMYDWKRLHLGWDLDGEIQAAETAAQTSPALDIYGVRDIVRRPAVHQLDG
jgi:hypothetical protein